MAANLHRSGIVEATCRDYHVTMKEPREKPVRVAILKARLSEYIRAARRGHPVVVYDRDTPVALRLVLGEPGQLAEWSTVERAVASALTEVECLRTLDRMGRRGALAVEDLAARRRVVSRCRRAGIPKRSLRRALIRMHPRDRDGVARARSRHPLLRDGSVSNRSKSGCAKMAPPTTRLSPPASRTASVKAPANPATIRFISATFATSCVSSRVDQ